MGYINIVSKEEKGRSEKDGGREQNQSRKEARLALSDRNASCVRTEFSICPSEFFVLLWFSFSLLFSFPFLLEWECILCVSVSWNCLISYLFYKDSQITVYFES